MKATCSSYNFVINLFIIEIFILLIYIEIFSTFKGKII